MTDGWDDLGIAAIVFGTFALALTGHLRFLVSPVTLWLGTISYPLYLIHRNLGYFSLDWLHEAGVPTTVALALVTLGALALACALTFVVEQPSRRFLRQWYRAKLA